MSRCALAAIGVAIFTAWIAAGSTGVVAHAFCHALTWLGLGTVLCLLWPSWDSRQRTWWILAGAAVLAVLGTASSLVVVNVLAVAVVLAALGAIHRGLTGRMLLATAAAVGVLAVYRLACGTMPVVWIVADRLGGFLGHVAGRIARRPLSVGATFGGVDYLVLMAALVWGWLGLTERPRRGRLFAAVAAVLACQLLYLIVLSFAADLQQALPLPPPGLPPAPGGERDITPTWFWGDGLRTMLPWNVPLLAAGLQTLVAVCLFARTRRWLPIVDPAEPSTSGKEHWVRQRGAWKKVAQQATKSRTGAAVTEVRPNPWGNRLRMIVATLLALLLSAAGTLAWCRGDLTGKTIVLCDAGGLNWDKPEHERYGQQAAGMYGMLPQFVESFGGKLVRRSDLTDADLAQADVLLLVQSAQPWKAETLARVRAFVARGGSLLLAADVAAGDAASAHALSDVLAGTALRVGSAAARPAVPKWRQSLEPVFHPSTAGLDDNHDRLVGEGGASIELGWSSAPPRPLVVGGWGWSVAGGEGRRQRGYQPGDRLGDLVLAAQQPLGRGTLTVLGDATCLSNLACVNTYLFVGRLLGCLAHRPWDPQAAWRMWLGLMLAAGLTLLWLQWPRPLGLAVSQVALAASLMLCTWVTAWSGTVLPDGRGRTPNPIAYIDASHLDLHAGMGWQPQGLNGLALNLMRNGWLPLLAPDVSSQRLERAGMFISIAPAREFSSAERQAVGQFVEQGGIFLAMVGAEHGEASRELLADFGFRVPSSPLPLGEKGPETLPVGYVYGKYGRDLQGEVEFYSVWPIQCTANNAAIRVANGNDPLVLTRPLGGRGGMAALIGDSRFAWNANLEQADGQPIQGRYRNPHFWRWFLGILAGKEEWMPPPETPLVQPPSTPEPSKPETVPNGPEFSPASGVPPKPQTAAQSEKQPGPRAPGTSRPGLGDPRAKPSAKGAVPPPPETPPGEKPLDRGTNGLVEPHMVTQLAPREIHT